MVKSEPTKTSKVSRAPRHLSTVGCMSCICARRRGDQALELVAGTVGIGCFETSCTYHKISSREKEERDPYQRVSASRASA